MFARYVVWQLPSWAVAVAVVAVLIRLIGLPVLAAVLILALYVGKDLALFPAMRVTFRPSSHSPWPIGERGQTIEPLEPTGYVKVGGELWRAEARPPDARIAVGRPVIVRSASGLTLFVEEDVEPGGRGGPEPPG
jgi:membrane protein implicated in regulation of membrane protease activity